MLGSPSSEERGEPGRGGEACFLGEVLKSHEIPGREGQLQDSQQLQPRRSPEDREDCCSQVSKDFQRSLPAAKEKHQTEQLCCRQS